MPIHEIQRPDSQQHANFEGEEKTQPAYFGMTRFDMPDGSGKTVFADQANHFATMQLVSKQTGASLGLLLGQGKTGLFYVMTPADARRVVASLIEMADEIDAGTVGGVA